MTLAIEPLTHDGIMALAPEMAAIDPWRRLGIDAGRLTASLTTTRSDVISFEARRDGTVRGLLSMRLDWLFGPYIRLLAVLPSAQSSGVGSGLIAHAADIARSRNDSNLWVCASAFNTAAIGFYERQGFARIGTLHGLVVPTEDEVLLRLQLTP